MEMVDAFLNKMYRTNADFVFTVARDFVRIVRRFSALPRRQRPRVLRRRVIHHP